MDYALHVCRLQYKFVHNFVLQATNVQGLGTRLGLPYLRKV